MTDKKIFDFDNFETDSNKKIFGNSTPKKMVSVGKLEELNNRTGLFVPIDNPKNKAKVSKYTCWELANAVNILLPENEQLHTRIAELEKREKQLEDGWRDAEQRYEKRIGELDQQVDDMRSTVLKWTEFAMRILTLKNKTNTVVFANAKEANEHLNPRSK
jgi:uncharacterized protein YukE